MLKFIIPLSFFLITSFSSLAQSVVKDWCLPKNKYQRNIPFHKFEDGVDYVPTNKFVLWGSHFTAVAGAAPIEGPAIAVYWGWMPALLWVTFGSIFFAGVHDFGALWASNRHDARNQFDVDVLFGNRLNQTIKLWQVKTKLCDCSASACFNFIL